MILTGINSTGMHWQHAWRANVSMDIGRVLSESGRDMQHIDMSWHSTVIWHMNTYDCLIYAYLCLNTYQVFLTDKSIVCMIATECPDFSHCSRTWTISRWSFLALKVGRGSTEVQGVVCWRWWPSSWVLRRSLPLRFGVESGLQLGISLKLFLKVWATCTG